MELPTSGRRHSQDPNLLEIKTPTKFLVSVNGRIESGEMFGEDHLLVKYTYSSGPDWGVKTGMEEGISQTTEKDGYGKFVWNFPFEVSFESTNPHGWPQLVLSVYGLDFRGTNIIRGYGSVHIPLSHGVHTKCVPLFVPESSSFLQRISSWLLGSQPEFVNPKIVAHNEGRQIIRVNSSGHIKVYFEVVLKDFAKVGYVTSTKKYGQSSES